MVRVPFPNQISTDEQVNTEALGWAQVLVDNIGKIRISELAFGQGTAVWPGAAAGYAAVLQIAHGLSKPPATYGAVFTQVNDLQIPGLTAIPVIGVHVGLTPQQFAVQVETSDGQNPANGSTATFYWLAML